MTTLNPLEQAVMQKLFNGDDESLAVLREQLLRCSVTQREMTGVGFYTTFAVDPVAPVLPRKPSIRFGDVIAKTAGLQFGAGFLLYVDAGVLHMLEGYSFDEPWPPNIADFELSYTPGPARDLEKLRQVLHPG